MRFTSSNSDVCIEFSDVESDYFRLSVKEDDHLASRRVYAYTDGAGIVRLFADAARECRDWAEALV